MTPRWRRQPHPQRLAPVIGVRGLLAGLIPLCVLVGCSSWFGEKELDAAAPLVAVVEHRTEDGDVSIQLLDALDEVEVGLLLRDRGYRSVPAAVTQTILRSAGAGQEAPTSEGGLAALRQTGVDYVLLRGVSKAELGADFRLRWRLVDARSGEPVWSGDRVGGPGRRIGTAMVGPLGIADEPQLSDDPIVGRGQQPEFREILTETFGEQAREVNERIIRLLPGP